MTDARSGSTTSFPRLRLNAALAALAASQPAMAVDTPAAGQVAASFQLAGWALDRGAATGAGVDSVHIWAYPGRQNVSAISFDLLLSGLSLQAAIANIEISIILGSVSIITFLIFKNQNSPYGLLQFK